MNFELLTFSKSLEKVINNIDTIQSKLSESHLKLASDKILVVDDCRTTTRYFEGFIKSQSSCQVFAFNNPKQAFQCLLDHSEINIIILDLIMPEMSGIEFLEKFNYRSLNVIVCSSFLNKMTTDRLQELGDFHKIMWVRKDSRNIEVELIENLSYLIFENNKIN